MKQAGWFKSTHSPGGSSCVEVWFKSSHSWNEGCCVEVKFAQSKERS